MKKIIGFFEGMGFAFLAMLAGLFVFGVGEELLIVDKKKLNKKL